MLDFIPKKPWYKKPKILISIAVILIILAVAGYVIKNKNSDDSGKVAGDKIYNVQALAVSDIINGTDNISISGLVKPDTQVDVIALGNGTIRGINFAIGDTVIVNSQLASIHDNNTLTNFGTAQNNFSNTQQSYTTTQRLVDESVNQAQQAVGSAEIGLKTVQDNYNNGKALQGTTKQDTFDNAISAYYGYLNTINNTLDQVDYIIKAEGKTQLSGIQQTLGITNSQSVITAKLSYRIARDNYKALTSQTITTSNIVSNLTKAVQIMQLTRQAVDDTVIVLNNTIPNLQFSEASLSAQKTNFYSLRNTIVSSITLAQTTLQGIKNIDSVQKRELDSLSNAVESAKNRLLQAQTAFNNAKESKQQQLISADIALNSSRGQLDIAGNQVADLTIKAPISGQVTQKFIELGTEVRAGQKVAEIAQIDLVKIEVDLASEDVYKIILGQTVMINDMFEGIITRINPVADSMTKKVRVEIFFDNNNKELIPETFVDINIPVSFEENANTASNRLYIPLKAVTITQTESYVFVVSQEGDEINKTSKAVKRNVTLGETKAGAIQIMEGLNGEDVVIIEGNRELDGGEIIEVRSEK
ncbi:MAG: efflux RND transporter periplasmic adaptor subunit [Patescibacteria group bacterium]